MARKRSYEKKLRKVRLIADFSRTVARHIVEAKSSDLASRLDDLAKLVAGMPNVQGAMVIAFDNEGKPLTSGTHNLSFRMKHSQLEGVAALIRQRNVRFEDSRWIPISSPLLDTSRVGSVLALPIHTDGIRSGLLMVGVPELPGRPRMTLQALIQVKDVVGWAIEDAVRSEALERVRSLQRLAIDTLNPSQPNLRELVKSLAKIFQAEAVTILRREQEELRLAASTDADLGKDVPVVYRSGMGLTGYVFQTGESLRLCNCNDPEGIRRLIGLGRQGPTHPERGFDGSYTTQFLGVPMRNGEHVEGVLRMSRREGAAQFTHYDEQSLQFFGDLLGVSLARSWELLLAKSIMETSSEAIAVSRREIDERGHTIPRIVFANTGAANLLDIERVKFIGLDAREIYAPGAYRRVHGQLEEALEQARKVGRSEHGPVLSRLKAADGTFRSVKISYRILADPFVLPPTFYTIGLARDTTESERQVAQHERLLEMLAELGLAYYRADKNGFTRESTAAESKITGYDKAELIGLNREALFTERCERDRLLERARQQGGQLLRARLKLHRKDGTIFWAEGDLRILKDISGQEIGVEGLYQDVTDRLQLQGFLNADTDRALLDDELFEKLKENAAFHLDYMTSLGHQLQTPLSSLVENLRNFERGVIDDRNITDRLPYVIGQAVVCTRLVRNLSYMDKVLRGESFQRRKIHLSKLALETKGDFLHLLKEKSIDLYIDKENLQRHLTILGHREMLRQVVVNLVDNAIKYSFPQSKIRICAHHWPQGRIFDITNRGLPIPEELREKIFERGFRTNRAKMTIPHGTGLGLWLIRKIVEAHGASIHCQEVFENNERLTLFRIVFPHKNANTRRTA